MTQRLRFSLRVFLLVVGGVALITYLANAIRRDYLLDRAIRHNSREGLNQLSPLFPSDVRKLSHYMRSNDSVVASRVETMLTVAVRNRDLTENAARLLPTAPVRGRPPFGLLFAMAGNYGFDEQVRATVRRALTTCYGPNCDRTFGRIVAVGI